MAVTATDTNAASSVASANKVTVYFYMADKVRDRVRLWSNVGLKTRFPNIGICVCRLANS